MADLWDDPYWVEKWERFRADPEFVIDGATAIVSPRVFRELNDYSCSLPTGQVRGKVWKRRRIYNDESKGWMLGEYADRDENRVHIRWRNLIVIGEADG